MNRQRDRFFTANSAFAPISDPLEEHYENWIFNFRERMFPDHYCFRFKPLVMNDWVTGVRPDLILIDRQYSEWVLVEVEKASHPWSSHVFPQLEKFRSARIGDEEISRLLKDAPDLSPDRLRSLILNEPPRILVVCNDKPSWSDFFLSTDAELMIVRPMRNEYLDLVLYADRIFNRRKYERLSFLEPPSESELIKWYRVTSPNRLEIREGHYLVDFDNGTFSCDIRKMSGNWYFAPPSSIVLRPSRSKHLSILRFSDSEITIEGTAEEV